MSLQEESTIGDGVNPNSGGQVQPPSPAAHPSETKRKIAIAVDFSEESAYAVGYAARNFLRPDDVVFILHIQPTSGLYGADWGSGPRKSLSDEESKKLEAEFDNFTRRRANDIARPLVEANIPFKIHIVKDCDTKERLCWEIERLKICIVIIGSRGTGPSKSSTNSGLGTVSDYCVNHCACQALLVRLPEGFIHDSHGSTSGSARSNVGEEVKLDPVPEDEQEYHDADGVKEVVPVAEVEKTAK